MLIDFFFHLRQAGLPVTPTEFLGLLAALKAQVATPALDEFYFLARTCLVKDERFYDRFDQAFGQYFDGRTAAIDAPEGLPADWLALLAARHLSPEDKARLEKLGWEKLMETFRQRLGEQKERHSGGSKWIGTGGSSPFGNGGYHPEGIRVEGESAGHRTAVKVWAQREFRNLDDRVELGTRNIKLALRRLRRFAREGAAEELDLEGTIAGTARNAGYLDLKLRPERHNKVKVLLFLDIGGSMDDHVRICEEVFSACRSEFKHLEHFYFHNCIYDAVWKDNRRRHSERILLTDLMHTYGEDYKLVIVGDATMSPYEITHPGGSVEGHNAEAGAAWMARLLTHYPAAAWLNPEPERLWPYRLSIDLLKQIMGDRMYPMTLAGLDTAVTALSKRR